MALSNNNSFKYVSKVSTRFEFFLSGFAYEPVLILILAVLDAEFYSLSIGIIFNGGHRAKIKGLSQNTYFPLHKKIIKFVFPVQIRL